MMYDVATALQWQVPHGGGLLGTVLSVPLVSLSIWAMTRRRLQKMRKTVARSGYASFLPPLPCVLSASMAQSDRTELSRLRHVFWLVSTSQSDQPELSLACVEAPIQPAGVVSVAFFFFSSIMASQGHT